MHRSNSKKLNINIRTEKRFRLLLLLLKMGGMPIISTTKVTNLQYIYCIFAPVSIYVSFIGTSLDAIVNQSEFTQFMSTIRAWFGEVIVIWLHTTLSMCKGKIWELILFTERFTWEELPSKDPETGRVTQAGLITFVVEFIKKSTIAVLSFHMIQSTVRIIISRDVIYNAWFPFNIKRSPTYEVFIILQILASFFSIGTVFGYLLLYILLVTIGCSQLEKLRKDLLGMKHKSPTSNTVQGTSNDQQRNPGQISSEGTFLDMKIKLNECIRLHQDILLYMRMLEEALHLIMGGLFLILLAALCLFAFSAVSNWEDPVDVSQAITALSLFVGKLYLFCIIGNEFTRQAEKVRDAAYGCDWLGAPIPFQRCICFIITIANKESRLTAAKFVPVSMVTFMHMIQQTYTFFMFLLQMRGRNTT